MGGLSSSVLKENWLIEARAGTRPVGRWSDDLDQLIQALGVTNFSD